MISLIITDITDFTKKLFMGNDFDSFLMVKADFTTDFYSRFDGTKTDPEKNSFITWGTFRPLAHFIVKGDRPPQRLRIVLRLTDENAANTMRSFGLYKDPDNVPSFFMNISYENGKFHVTSGTAFRTFESDRDADRQWGHLVKKFLDIKGIGHETT